MCQSFHKENCTVTKRFHGRDAEHKSEIQFGAFSNGGRESDICQRSKFPKFCCSKGHTVLDHLGGCDLATRVPGLLQVCLFKFHFALAQLEEMEENASPSHH